jgi:hypothetical protein
LKFFSRVMSVHFLRKAAFNACMVILDTEFPISLVRLVRLDIFRQWSSRRLEGLIPWRKSFIIIRTLGFLIGSMVVVGASDVRTPGRRVKVWFDKVLYIIHALKMPITARRPYGSQAGCTTDIEASLLPLISSSNHLVDPLTILTW